MELQRYLGQGLAVAGALLVAMTFPVSADQNGTRDAPVVLTDLDIDSVAGLMVAGGADGSNICAMLKGQAATSQATLEAACTKLKGDLYSNAESWEGQFGHSKEIYLRLDGFALLPLGFDADKGVLSFCMPRRLKSVAGKAGVYSGLRLGHGNARALLSISGPANGRSCPPDSLSKSDLREDRLQYGRPFRRLDVTADQFVAEAVLETAETNEGRAALRGPVICRLTAPRNSRQLAGCELVGFTMSNPAPGAQPNLFFWDAGSGLYIGAN